MSVVPASNRVLVTGIGAVTPLGLSFKDTWNNLLKGYSGIKKMEFEDHPYLQCKIAATIPRVDNDLIKWNDPENNENPPDVPLFKTSDFLSKSESYYSAHCIQYALAAAGEAMRTSGLAQYLEDDKLRGKASIVDRYRIGVAVASGMGGLDAIERDHDKLRDGNFKKISPYCVPNMLVNSACGAISLRYGLHGPNLAQATACAASSHAIQEGYSLIASGLADIVVCGGTEAAITPLAVAGFCRCKALATKYNDTPSKSSRPWDKKRNGFVMGEGSAILVLESERMAEKRGVTDVYGELIGIASTADAYHVTSLDPAGHHVQKCMQLALDMGKRNTMDRDLVAKLGYINAHATSTDIGDKTELKAILQTMHHSLGDVNYKLSGPKDSLGASEAVCDAIRTNLKISGTKSSIGHLLGASGAIEAALTLNALKTMTAPPTKNLDIPDDFVPKYVNLVPNEPQPLSETTQYAMSNSFGFGGTNGCLLFKKRDKL
eukprot:30837_1